MEVSGQLHAPAALPLRKRPQYPMDRRLGGAQRLSERGGEEYSAGSCLKSGPGYWLLESGFGSSPQSDQASRRQISGYSLHIINFKCNVTLYEGVSKNFRNDHRERELQIVQLSLLGAVVSLFCESV
jgi:hypothetical protein